ncbi:bacillithiol biosynthesis cysteine-adding enzyme BshC [Fulvivirga sedimenti]|uniref:Putative cysteine ligase BshC n=1 Tax=Fulvivirga sedimenti TaxID=2879465 RepID=A0A9X1HYL9_9BACT|nr:bacillithiol biosynthesis cysteine-adding enzyme BshC [Fulvivirga sedimenti]MCA6078982.1 bacillithiol biosynthesis cysteine-adding enzyme BshC [Fulvivirga sedimenti]
MKHTLVDLKDTGSFSGFFLDYLAGKDQLRSFYTETPDIKNFGKQIERSSFPQARRKILVDTLTLQYEGMELEEEVRANLGLLGNGNTYTITTGHQLNIFTGPLYVIYKLVTIIRACQDLKAQYPEHNFVPVYWMASEDHDFAEINHFHFNGETYRWDTDQMGAVGRFLTSDMKPLLEKLSAVPPFFHQAYQGRKTTLAQAVRSYLNHLFGEYGLLILDADNRAQKSLLQKVMEDDILHQRIKPVVDATTDQLESLGYSTQIHPRPINFFYISENGRFRITEEGGTFTLVDGDRSFTRAEIEKEIAEFPERFSPNVVLRPLYEELILPNLAYVGGPSELVYWLQLGGLFKVYDVPFPILLPRNFALILPEHVERKREKTGLDILDLFQDTESLIADQVRKTSSRELSLEMDQDELKKIFDQIREKASSIDPTLVPHVEAQQARLQRTVENIEKKFIRAEKRHHSDLRNQITALRESLFPGGTLQERYENFLNFYQNDPSFIEMLMQTFDPFDLRFNIITYGK